MSDICNLTEERQIWAHTPWWDNMAGTGDLQQEALSPLKTRKEEKGRENARTYSLSGIFHYLSSQGTPHLWNGALHTQLTLRVSLLSLVNPLGTASETHPKVCLTSAQGVS